MSDVPLRIVIVTGANGAIGEAITRQIAALPGYRVVMVCRNEAKARAAAERIRAATGNQAVSYRIADLSRKSEIDTLASGWEGPLEVLINNASTTPRARRETPEGIEMQFATNVLGYLWMSEAFTPHLRKAAPARIVNVASYWAGGLDLDDLEFKRRRYDNDSAYRQSKQAERMLTVALAERLAADGIVVNSCHPGDVNSQLSNDLGFGGSQSPDQGARTPVWLASSAPGGRLSGKYFADLREAPCRFGKDREGVEALYRICKGYG
ncbi:MAG: SDR family NAD(P)-dependent oxidoreductase [Calditrichae bacterium]|nr:SDR family NAD(P)-dependent oxidoreductase [Calditrichia bacterium]